jgi:hypothetical protein
MFINVRTLSILKYLTGMPGIVSLFKKGPHGYRAFGCRGSL